MRRTPEFDALRGIAALAIVIHHLWFPSFSPMATALNLFFVLSGYLITGIILRNLDDPNFLPVFYARRALRIWPIYYLGLFAVLGLNAVSPRPRAYEGLPAYLLYLPNLQCYWFGPETPFLPSFLHTWTLAIEEQFYILWPVALLLGGRRVLRPLALSLIAVAVVARTAGFSRWILLTQCDGLLLGGLLAGWLAGRERREGLAGLAAWACLLAAAFTVAGAPAMSRLGGACVPAAASLKVLATNLFYFGLVGLVVHFSGHPALGVLRDRRLEYLGRISYGLYLYHYILFRTGDVWLDHFRVARSWWTDLAMLAACVAVAALSWRFVERPILALKDRFDYRRPPGAGATGELGLAWQAPGSPVAAGPARG